MCIRNLKQLLVQNCVRTEGQVAWCLLGGNADARLEPLPVAVDQRNHCDRHIAGVSRLSNGRIKNILRRRVEYAQLLQSLQARELIQGDWVSRVEIGGLVSVLTHDVAFVS